MLLQLEPLISLAARLNLLAQSIPLWIFISFPTRCTREGSRCVKLSVLCLHLSRPGFPYRKKLNYQGPTFRFYGPGMSPSKVIGIYIVQGSLLVLVPAPTTPMGPTIVV